MLGIAITDGTVTYNVFWLALFVLLMILDVVLRALSLWRSAKKNQVTWFVCLLIFNTLGILPAIYLLTRPKKKK